MSEVRYMISDAAKQVEVEAHVLRYWEEELDLKISRNEMGHRYYTKADIDRFKNIKIMKERGYQLKAIKMELLGGGNLSTPACTGVTAPVPTAAAVPEKEKQILTEENQGERARYLLKSIIAEVLDERNMALVNQIDEKVGNKVIKQMDYLFREKEERDEVQYQKFDSLLREQQNSLKVRKENRRKEERAVRKAEKKAEKLAKKAEARKVETGNIHAFQSEPKKERRLFHFLAKEEKTARS